MDGWYLGGSQGWFGSILFVDQVGTQFDVTINETGRSYPATVSLINARVDAVAQTIELEARMVNAEPDLLAGMSGVARFSLSID